MSRDGRTPSDGKSPPFGDGQGKSSTMAKPRDILNDRPFQKPSKRQEEPDQVPDGGENPLAQPTLTPKQDSTGQGGFEPLGGGQKPYRFAGG